MFDNVAQLSSAPGKPGLLEETDMNKCDASNCPLEGTTTKLPNGGSMTLCPEHRAKLEAGSPVLIGSSDALLAVQPSLASTFLAAGIEAWMASVNALLDRADQVFIIEDLEGERDAWKQRFKEAVIAHASTIRVIKGEKGGSKPNR